MEIIIAFAVVFLYSCGILCASQKVPNYSFMHNATSAPSLFYYDYIVIGGGVTGCPLASTLSQNATVLLLERGGSPYGNPNITEIRTFGNALSDLSLTSPSQRFVSEDGVINARARVLGGGSAINAGFYSHAEAEFIRNSGLEEKLVNESYRWVEEKVAFESPVTPWQSAVRKALVEVGEVPDNGFTYDHVYGTKVAGSIFDRNGHRHTAADLLEYARPTTITVLLHATVHKVLFNTTGKTRPVARGVVYRDEDGIKHRAYLKNGAKSEIIVSAGAIGSPQLLMLSGVGPRKHLKAHNIKVVLNKSNVGQGMADNPMNAVFIPSPVPVEVSLSQVVGITRVGIYIEANSGKNFTSNFVPDYGMVYQKPMGQFTLPTNQRTPAAVLTEAIEPMNNLGQAEVKVRGGYILEKVIGPLSTGHLMLRTQNPADDPSVTFNYFKHPQDLERCIQGISIIEKIIESKSFSKYKYKQMSPQFLLNLTAQAQVNFLPRQGNSSASIEQFCKDTVMTIWHYHGGCQVGKVVDSNYKVIGLDKIRVIDGSTFDSSPGTNPQATLMMLGRYMGVQILRERLHKEDSE